MFDKQYLMKGVPCSTIMGEGDPPGSPKVLVLLPSQNLMISVPAHLFDGARAETTEVHTFRHAPYELPGRNSTYEVPTSVDGDPAPGHVLEDLVAVSFLFRAFIDRDQHLGWGPPGPSTAFVVPHGPNSLTARDYRDEQRLLRGATAGNTPPGVDSAARARA